LQPKQIKGHEYRSHFTESEKDDIQSTDTRDCTWAG